MLDFKVYALNAHGALIEIEISASSEEEARLNSINSGLDVIQIHPINNSRHLFKIKKKFDLAIFAYELLTLLKAGLSLIETLETLRERQKNGQDGGHILSELIRKMREGQSFSTALKSYPEYFPSLFIASISASEQTGDMVDALHRFLRYHEQMNVIRQKMISASIYPILLLTVGFAVALFLLCFLVPRFSHVYDDIDAELPLASKLLMQWGMFADQNLGIIFLVIGFFLVLFIFIVRTATFRYLLSDFILKNHWIGLQYRLLQLSRFYRSLGLLLSGGIPIVKALQMTQDLLSSGLSVKLNQAIIDVQQGKALTVSLSNAGLTTAVALRLLGAGERNGQLADMFEQVASFHDKEVSAWVDKFTRLFEPILMLIIGLVIGGIVILLYLPIFELAGSLS